MGNVLILSAGRRVELAYIVQRELDLLSQGSIVVLADADPIMAPACRIGDFKSVKVRHAKCADYIDDIVGVCITENIGLIIPTIDTELMILSKNKSRLNALGIEVMVSDEEFVAKTLNKIESLGLFDDLGIGYADRYSNADEVTKPCIIRPATGSSSVGIAYVGMEEVKKMDVFHDGFIVQEDIRDDYVEDSIDLYYSKMGRLIDYCFRERVRTRGGEISIGRVHSQDIDDFVSTKLRVLEGAMGIITFQRLRKGCDFKAIEINARVAGGYPMSDLCGCRLIRLAINEYLLGLPSKRIEGKRKQKLCLRYDRTLEVEDESYSI